MMRERHKKILAYLTIVIFLISCIKSADEGSSVELAPALESEKRALLSDFCPDVSAIALETNDSCLLNGRSYVVFVDSTDIFISSDQIIYRFDKDGKFKNKIGIKGNGSMEYVTVYSVMVDNDNKKIILYTGHNKVQYWSYEGDFLTDVKLNMPDPATKVDLMNKKYFVSEVRKYSDDGLNICIGIFDLDGAMQSCDTIYSDIEKNQVSMFNSPIIYSYGDHIHYKNDYMPELFEVTKKGAKRVGDFNLGKYAPDREYIENMSVRSQRNSVAQIVDFRENESYYFILLVMDSRLRGVIWDKNLSRVSYSQWIDMPQKGGGIDNDFIAGTKFWPSYISSDGNLYGLLSVDCVSKEGISDLKSMFRIDLMPDTNPLLIIGECGD